MLRFKELEEIKLEYSVDQWRDIGGSETSSNAMRFLAGKDVSDIIYTNEIHINNGNDWGSNRRVNTLNHIKEWYTNTDHNSRLYIRYRKELDGSSIGTEISRKMLTDKAITTVESHKGISTEDLVIIKPKDLPSSILEIRLIGSKPYFKTNHGIYKEDDLLLISSTKIKDHL